MITGPPGAGKSTVSGHLVELLGPSAVIPADQFFGFLRNGAVSPWLPGAGAQNESVIAAAAAAAGRLSTYCDVVYDGVVDVGFRESFLRWAGRSRMHYAVLMPPLDVCRARVRTRDGHGFVDLDATARMWRQFDQADIESPCVFTDSELSPAEIAQLIAARVASGSLQYRATVP